MERSENGLETSQTQNLPDSDGSSGETQAQSRAPRAQRSASQKSAAPVTKGNETDQSDEPRALDLASLFKEDGNESENTDVADDLTKPPDSIERAAKRLGLTPEQVYSVKVPMPNGAEPISIGDLKDRVGELVDLETREAAFDQRRMKAEGGLLRAQTEMREILAMLPRDQIKPEMVEKVRKRHEAVQTEERRLTLQHIPDWENEERRLKDITGISGWLQEAYGFDEAFITTVVDHRALKFMRDAYLRNERIKAALAKVTIPTKKGQRPSTKAPKSASRPNTSQSRRGNLVPTQDDKLKQLFGTE